MKLDLLSSASLIALGTTLALSMPGVAHAGLSCTPLTATTGSCTETDYLFPASQKTDISNVDLAIDKFNSAVAGPGTVLTSVQLVLGGSYTSSGTIVAPATGSGVSATYSNSVSLSIKAPGMFPTFSTTAASQVASYTFASTASQPFATNQTFPTAPQTITSGLSAFSGTGAFNALVSTMTGVGFHNNGATGTFTDVVNTYVDPSVIVTYDYTTAVPEPATIGLLGAGLSGLGVIRRRRR